MYTEYIMLYLLGFFITFLALINVVKATKIVQDFNSDQWIMILVESLMFPIIWISLLIALMFSILWFLLTSLWKFLIKNRKIEYSKHLAKKNEMQKIRQ